MCAESEIAFIERQDDIQVVDKEEMNDSNPKSWVNVVLAMLVTASAVFAIALLVQEGLKRQLVREFAEATASGKLYVLIENTDWHSVRIEMIRELRRRAIQSNASLPGQADEMEDLVNYYVQPDSVLALVDLYREKAGQTDPKAFVRQVHFSGLTEMTVEIASPPQPGKAWMNSLEPVRAVFELDGMQMAWKLKKLQAPDYLIPTHLPAQASRRT